MIKMLAPLVMASCASESSVASLPCAFTTENCEVDRPARARAWDRYGASNSVYRAEVTVSGRMTATLPLPRPASGLSCDMADMVRLRALTEIDGTAAELELPLPVPALDDEELLQPAAARHKATDTDATAAPFLATGII